MKRLFTKKTVWTVLAIFILLFIVAYTLGGIIHEVRQRSPASSAQEKKTDLTSHQEARKKLYDSVGEEIRQYAVLPPPGQYLVEFFDRKDVPPMNSSIGFSNRDAFWIDDKTILFRAQFYKRLPNGVLENTEAKLAVLHTDTRSVTFVEQIHKDKVFCYDPKTRALKYFMYKGDETQTNDVVLYNGKLNHDLKFVKESEFYAGYRRGKYIFNPMICKYFEKADPNAVIGIFLPGDGKLRVKISDEGRSRHWGRFIRHKNDGSTEEIDIGWRTQHPETPRYDPYSDRYLLATKISREDQRIKIWWFDRSFRVVEEYMLPRVHSHMSFPGAGSLTYTKEGFLTDCHYRGTSSDKPEDLGHIAPKEYLCLVKPDKITYLLEGVVQSLAVSPDGCRIFGLWMPETTSHRGTAKNVMINICQKYEEEN